MAQRATRQLRLAQTSPLAEDTMAAIPLVLDTNAALDWLLFDDPGMRALAAAIQAKQLQWLACERMREELSHMLHHNSLAHWQPDAAASLALFDRWAQLRPLPAASHSVCCTDVDDQMFVDLALAHGARWLVSHDRAVLKLGRKLRLHGIAVLKPAQWVGPWPDARTLRLPVAKERAPAP
jgi:predicted nucleic acid-binding protein